MQEEIEDKEVAIPIYDKNDKAEIAVKERLRIGQVYPSMNFVFDMIGLENLEIKSLKGGKQKKMAGEKLAQYAELRPVLEGKHKRQCIDIYEVPHYLDKEDGRGKKGFYITRLLPIMISFFLTEGESSITTTVSSFVRGIGIVSRLYRNVTQEELIQYNQQFSASMLSQFYFRCKPEVESILYRTLDKLQDDYSVLNYSRNYCIVTETDKHTSSRAEEIMIRKMQRQVLKEFNANSITQILFRRQEKKFFNRVCEVINETFDLNWRLYFNQLQIDIDLDGIRELEETLGTESESITQYKSEIKERLSQRVKRRTQYDFDRTNEIAASKLESWKKNGVSDELAEIIMLDIYTDMELMRLAKIFRYYDDYVEIQDQLIELIIGV